MLIQEVIQRLFAIAFAVLQAARQLCGGCNEQHTVDGINQATLRLPPGPQPRSLIRIYDNLYFWGGGQPPGTQ